MNKFIKDDSWQKKIRNKILQPYYKKISYNQRFVFVDKGILADKLQREMAIDTIIQLKNNGILGIEEKIVRWPGYEYQNYTLETWSCTVAGLEKQGWMYYATCDYLFYCFVQNGDDSLYIHVIPFSKLQNWFFEHNRFENYRSFITDQVNKTETKIVPIKDVWDAIPECKSIYVTQTEISL
jgi:hypothetical protein